MVRVAAGTAMTQDLTPGALTSGDDGAVQFNSVAGASADVLDAPDPLDPIGGVLRRFNFTLADGPDMTLSGWVKPQADAATFRAGIVSNWVTGGWMLGVDWPARTPVFIRQSTGGTHVTLTGPTLSTSDWSFVAATFDSTDGYKLYVNGGLVDSDPSTSPNLTAFNLGPVIGGGDYAARAAVDEVAVWGDALTAGQINTLYTTGTSSGGTGAAYQVLESDGAGGTRWAFPTVEVRILMAVGRFSRLTLGTNLTGTDQGDGELLIDATGGGATPADTLAWMPLTTVTGGVPELVWDATDDLIPTLTPF